MKYWVDYYNKRASSFEDPLIASEMDLGSISSYDDEKNKLLHYLNPKNNETLLDLGCSNGNGIHLIKDYYKQIIGVDLSSNSISRCKERFPEFDFILDDISTLLKVKSFSFNTVLLYGVLHYLSDKEIESLFYNLDRISTKSMRIVIIKAANKLKYDDYQIYRKKQGKNVDFNDINSSWNFIDPSMIETIGKQYGFCFNQISEIDPKKFPLSAFFNCFLERK